MNHRSAEALVAHLRKRKRRIIGHIVCLVVSLGMLAVFGWLIFDLYHRIVPKNEADLAIVHLVQLQQVTVAIAFIQSMMLLFALGFGYATGMLLNELTTFTKDELLVNLWDRVNLLEKSPRDAP